MAHTLPASFLLAFLMLVLFPQGCSENNAGSCKQDIDCPGVEICREGHCLALGCGDGIIQQGESCDPPSTCPVSCDDGLSCTTDTLSGASEKCTAVCHQALVTQCVGGDSCCPAGCSNANDADCSASCGDGVSDPGETCGEPGLSSCPDSCDDSNLCTSDLMTGSAQNCNAACSHFTIAQCQGGDGCCPAGCNSGNDTDCSAFCGNGVPDSGETCGEPGLPACPTICSDSNPCTSDLMTGSAQNCNAACSHSSITQCQGGDDCCPANCNANNDTNCSPQCGNGVIESGEGFLVSLHGANKDTTGKLISTYESKAVPSSLWDRNLYAAEFYSKYYSYWSNLYLVNPSNLAATVNILLTGIDNYSTTYSFNITICAHCTFLGPEASWNLTDGRYAVVVSSSEPLMGSVFSWQNPGLTTPDRTISENIDMNHMVPKSLASNRLGNAKAYYKAARDATYPDGRWESGHAVVNVLAQSVTVRITVTNGDEGGGVVLKANRSLGPNQTASIYMRNFIQYAIDNNGQVPTPWTASEFHQDKIFHLDATCPDNCTTETCCQLQGSLMAETAGGEQALIGYYQLSQSDAVRNDTLSYVAMSAQEGSVCNYHFPMYFYYHATLEQYVSGFTTMSLDSVLNGVSFDWLRNGTPVEHHELTFSIPAGASRQHAFYNDNTNSQYYDQIFVNKACSLDGNTRIVGLNNTTRNVDYDVAFGDSSFSEIWIGAQAALPMFRTASSFNGFTVFNPSPCVLQLNLKFYQNDGTLVLESNPSIPSQNTYTYLVEQQDPNPFASGFYGLGLFTGTFQ